MPFYQYYGFTQVFIMLDVGLRLQDHPPPRNGGMAMAIPRTTLEDGLQDEARKNANIILTGFLYTVLLLFWVINSILFKKKKKKDKAFETRIFDLQSEKDFSN